MRGADSRDGSHMPKLLALLAVAVLGHATAAHAVISAATTVDGPSADMVALGGVAMAEDGTGGLVYTKLGEATGESTYMRCGS